MTRPKEQASLQTITRILMYSYKLSEQTVVPQQSTFIANESNLTIREFIDAWVLSVLSHPDQGIVDCVLPLLVEKFETVYETLGANRHDEHIYS